MAPLNLSKRESKLFYLTVIAVLFLLGHNFVVKPLMAKWNKVDEKIKEGNLKLEKGERLAGKEKSITSDYDRIAAAIKMKGSQEEEMAGFLTEIESLANSTGVHINEIKPLPAKQFDLYKKFYTDLELEGEMAQISDFMRRVQDSPHILAIDKLSLGSKEAGTSTLRCRLVISKIAVL